MDRIVLSYNQIVILMRLDEGESLIDTGNMITLFGLDVTADARILRRLGLVDYGKSDIGNVYTINDTGRSAFKSGTALTTVSYLMSQK